MNRRERTRQLIELGGLVSKAGIVELTDDDRAAIYGALLGVAAILRGSQREQSLTRWRRRGKRAFEDDHSDGSDAARVGIAPIGLARPQTGDV